MKSILKQKATEKDIPSIRAYMARHPDAFEGWDQEDKKFSYVGSLDDLIANPSKAELLAAG